MSDVEALLMGFDPPVKPPVLPESDVSYTVADAPVGRLVLAAAESGLISCSYSEEREVLDRIARFVSPRILRSRRRLDPALRELDQYFANRLRRFTVPVDLALASPFTRSVLEALSRVPYGTTTSYGALARVIRRPRASRAVGHALGANPACVLLPCHRVVNSDGGVGGYAGGVAAKRMLLDLEASSPGK